MGIPIKTSRILTAARQNAIKNVGRTQAGSDPARATADIQFVLPGQAVHELLAWSSCVQAVSPAHIRTAIVERLTAALRRYPEVK